MGCTKLKKDDCLNNVCRDYDKCRPDLAHSTTPSAGLAGYAPNHRSLMMQTFNRICIKDHKILDGKVILFKVECGKEYLTSAEKDNQVTVFSTSWVKAPVSIFAGAQEFTSA